jgi:hypothetical protein
MIEEAGLKFQAEAQLTSNKVWLKEMKDTYAEETHTIASKKA